MKKYVIGRIKLKPGKRDAFLALHKDYAAASRKDAGVVYFQNGPDYDDPDGMIIIECWATPEAHAAHNKQPHFAAFGPVFMDHVLHAHFEEMDVGDVHDVVLGSS